MKKLKTAVSIATMALIMVVLGLPANVFANYTEVPDKFSLDSDPVCLFLNEASATNISQVVQPDTPLYTFENDNGVNLAYNRRQGFAATNTPTTIETKLFRPFSDSDAGNLLASSEDVTFTIYKAKTPEELAISLNNGFSILLESKNQGKMNLFSTNRKNQPGVHHAPIPSSALLLSTVLIGLIGFRWRTTMN